ncbi:MAG: hypothetical protein WBD07_05185 [Vicinamibacterales bacterium]
MKRIAIVVCAMLALGTLAPQAQSPVSTMSPIIGLWETNVEKSTYFPGPKPVAAGFVGGRNYIDRGNGLIAEVRLNVNALGQPALANVWSGKLDGVATAVFNQGDLLTFLEAGTKPMPTRAYKIVNPSTLEYTNKTGMVVNNTATLVISSDGKTLTETIKNFNAQGAQAGQNVIVLERQ